MATDERNKHGLQRYIRADIRRRIRQRCGFGCVRCGRAIIDYEHFDPPFHECTDHVAEGITLLCIECHGLKERGWIDAGEIRDADADPFCKREGFSFGPFYIGRKEIPEIRVGVVIMRNVKCALRINGDEILSIKAPETEGGPFLLSAQFFDISGKRIMSVVDNEWRVRSENWDVQAEGEKKNGKGGGKITIRRAPGDIALQIRVEPPNLFIVERLEMEHKGVKISCSEGKPLTVQTVEGISMKTEGWEINEADEGIIFEEGILSAARSPESGRRSNIYIKSMSFSTTGAAKSSISGELRENSEQSYSEFQRGPLVSEFVFNRVRNSPCPCRGGRLYKDCHGKLF